MPTDPTDPVLLYAIPYAGGHSLVYREMQPLLAPTVHLRPLDPPGRGKRSRESVLRDMELIADDLVTRILEDLSQAEASSGSAAQFALFGHSMGSLLAYLAAVRLTGSGRRPLHLFCSGHSAPSIPKLNLESGEQPKHSLDRDGFWAYIESLGALPPELKTHTELMDYFEPILRADIQALETYRYTPLADPLDAPITVIYGLDDIETPLDELLPWQRETQGSMSLIPVAGAHFGLFNQLPFICDHIRSMLTRQP